MVLIGTLIGLLFYYLNWNFWLGLSITIILATFTLWSSKQKGGNNVISRKDVGRSKARRG